ncbi:substrate-binding domain-containing protein [Termitidicoccus mucosus]|uniref:HTH gntR-type domain-containing protein n=1 Tax=Termitidicoccus mucosus TaxID=1184151 RepID=A0A178IDG9_9BACT|nr:hypothetical protein AW736_20605 [Opitutaceae bacterium TSB47]
MPSSFHSISTQVANTLREELEAGIWKGKLPGERRLATRLNVSRKTVRRALAMLRADGMIQTKRNRASLLVRKTGVAAKKQSGPITRVALLLPEPVETARPFTILWINHLMSSLHNAGMELEIFSGWKYFGQNAPRSLSQLVRSHPGRCWIIARSNHSIQHWFASRSEPAVVAGSTFDDIELPSVDIDQSALCRHAALAFIRQGHRRLVFFHEEKAVHGADAASEQAFLNAVLEHKGYPEPLIIRPPRGMAAVVREFQRIQGMPVRPTGFLCSNPLLYLTLFGFLAHHGLRVPRDVSLISREVSPLLSQVHPAPTRYSIVPSKFALALYHAIKRMLEQGAPRRFDMRIIPDFIKGNTLGPAPE